MIFAVLGVFVVLIALAWLVVMRWLNHDGFPVRESLEEDGSVRRASPEREQYAAGDRGLGRAKDRNVAETWDPGL
jgi:hypothetical protein